jgi:hypothetical protein
MHSVDKYNVRYLRTDLWFVWHASQDNMCMWQQPMTNEYFLRYRL